MDVPAIPAGQAALEALAGKAGTAALAVMESMLRVMSPCSYRLPRSTKSSQLGSLHNPGMVAALGRAAPAELVEERAAAENITPAGPRAVRERTVLKVHPDRAEQ